MSLTPWHITFSTYGARLHGDQRPTVDREHNTFGTPFLAPDRPRNDYEHEQLNFSPVILTKEQQQFIEDTIPSICDRGGWEFIACAAGADHVHALLAEDPRIHGKQIRPLLKRWLTQALDSKWNDKHRERSFWWSEGGSTKAVKDARYFENAKNYIERQRTKRRA